MQGEPRSVERLKRADVLLQPAERLGERRGGLRDRETVRARRANERDRGPEAGQVAAAREPVRLGYPRVRAPGLRLVGTEVHPHRCEGFGRHPDRPLGELRVYVQVDVVQVRPDRSLAVPFPQLREERVEAGRHRQGEEQGAQRAPLVHAPAGGHPLATEPVPRRRRQERQRDRDQPGKPLGHRTEHARAEDGVEGVPEVELHHHFARVQLRPCHELLVQHFGSGLSAHGVLRLPARFCHRGPQRPADPPRREAPEDRPAGDRAHPAAALRQRDEAGTQVCGDGLRRCFPEHEPREDDPGGLEAAGVRGQRGPVLEPAVRRPGPALPRVVRHRPPHSLFHLRPPRACEASAQQGLQPPRCSLGLPGRQVREQLAELRERLLAPRQLPRGRHGRRGARHLAGLQQRLDAPRAPPEAVLRPRGGPWVFVLDVAPQGSPVAPTEQRQAVLEGRSRFALRGGRR